MLKFKVAWGLFTSVALSTTTVLGLASGIFATPVAAAEAQPPTDWSYYIQDNNYQTAKTLGCNQGKFDASKGHSSMVVLDFGVQTSDGSGTITPIDNKFEPTATIEQMTLWFAAEYFRNRLESYAAGLERAARERDAQVMRRSMSRVMPA